MTIEERVKRLVASISDPDERAEQIVAFVRASLQAEALVALQERQEALASHRRELAAERQRRHRGEVSRGESVTERDEALQTVTERDTQKPAESPQKALAPAPSGGFGGSLSGSLPVSSSDPVFSPDLSEPDPEDPHCDERSPLTRYSSPFVQFWEAYPRKVGKDAAWRAWKRIQPALAPILAALSWQRNSMGWKSGYIPNPATYLNQGRWQDEPTQSPQPRPPPTPARNFRQEATQQAFEQYRDLRARLQGGKL